MEMTVNALVEENMGLVKYTISKYFNKSYTDHNPLYENEDLIQIGSIGLLNAAKSYDESKGKFSTYAVTAIRNAITNAFKYQANHERTDDFSTRIEYSELTGEKTEFKTDALDCYDLIADLTCNLAEADQKKAEMLLSYMSMGYNVNESAKKSGLSAGRAYYYLHQIKQLGKPRR